MVKKAPNLALLMFKNRHKLVFIVPSFTFITLKPNLHIGYQVKNSPYKGLFFDEIVMR